MIKTHSGPVGKEQLPINPVTQVRGRRLHQGEITKFGNFGNEGSFGKFTTTPDNLTFQPYPYYGPNR